VTGQSLVQRSPMKGLKGLKKRPVCEAAKITFYGLQSHGTEYDYHRICVEGLRKSDVSVRLVSHLTENHGTSHMRSRNATPWNDMFISLNDSKNRLIKTDSVYSTTHWKPETGRCL
jgi:hypothetical protein